MIRRHKKWAALVAFIGLVGGGVAFAAWNTTGSGTGAAKAGQATAVNVSAGTPNSTLYPGASADVAVTISNPNPFPVHVSGINLDTSGSQAGSTVYGITASDGSCNVNPTVTYANQTNGGTGWSLAAHGSSGDSQILNLTGAISMSNVANDSCQNNSFTVYLTAVAASGSS